MINAYSDYQAKTRTTRKRERETPTTYDLLGQLNRTQASISILELLQTPPKHQEVFNKFLSDARVPVETTDLYNVVGILTAPMAISFSDDDLPNGKLSPHI